MNELINFHSHQNTRIHITESGRAHNL